MARSSYGGAILDIGYLLAYDAVSFDTPLKYAMAIIHTENL